MDIEKTKSLNSEEKQTVFDLWNRGYPVKLGFRTIIELENYLNTLTDVTYYLLKTDSKVIEGWAMTFSAAEEKWFAITIADEVQRQGKGTYLMNKLKTENEILNGWVIDHENDLKANGELYQSPLLFYERNGFQKFPECRLEIPILSAVKITWHSKDASE
jgi:GNAT superfamily N-acetyltransferase